MDQLTFSLHRMCEANKDGSFTTRAQRRMGLTMMAGELRRKGFKLPDATSLKPKHVQALLTEWRAQGISDATIKNRMGWVRWWAMKTNKVGLIPRDNAQLGIRDKTIFKGQRASSTPKDQLHGLSDNMALAIRLQMAFGLRLEESIKFRAKVADGGDHVSLVGSWCKNGRSRVIPITHPRQRALLDELHAACGDGSLIPAGMNYIQFRKAFEHAAISAGISNMHKHRHWYAQWRYTTLTGVKPPAGDGPLHSQVEPAMRTVLDDARLQISQELGHNRLDVTDAYLGNRWKQA